MGVSCCVIAARFSIYEVPYTTLFYSNILTFSPPSSPPSSPPAFPFSAATVASATTGASPCAASTLAPPAASVDVRCSIIWLFERVTSNEKQRYFDTHGGQLQELQIQSRAHTHTRARTHTHPHTHPCSTHTHARGIGFGNRTGTGMECTATGGGCSDGSDGGEARGGYSRALSGHVAGEGGTDGSRTGAWEDPHTHTHTHTV